ncbi:MAG: hypothetical protein IKL07_10795, partial [Clostridium sp.]|nr:hypothetical protein [Clostridium sp.]
IEYSKENSLVIEYYTKEEWKHLEDVTKMHTSAQEVAKEIIDMTKSRKLNINEYIGKPDEIRMYESYDKLKEELNDYVGENGKFTPIVKSVTLRVNHDELQEISIVDTPGLYDPVISRSYKTKKFMELCDVVFFLSKTGSFLDANDLELLMSHLPQKGVKKLILLGSRFDDGIRDIIWKEESLSSAVEVLNRKLIAYTDRMLSAYKKNNYFIHEEVLKQIEKPMFISSVCYNMGKKKVEDYNEQERKIYRDLSIKEPVTSEELLKIGNIDGLRDLFEEIVDEKDTLLEEKARNFVPTAMEELRGELVRTKKISERRIVQLNRYDKEQILEQKKAFLTQINGINSDLEEIFGNWCVKIESNKAQGIRELRGYYRDYLQLSEKEGIKTHFETKASSTAKWFLPWTWGNTRREVYSYDERYRYIDASDALENIRNFANDASVCIEETFHKSYDLAYTKRELLNTIINHFDATDENYTPTYYKMLVEKILNQVTLPVVNIDTSSYVSSLTTQFFGEIRDNATRTDLKRVLTNAVSDLFADICHSFEKEIAEYKARVEQIKEEFSGKLLNDINKELNTVLAHFEDKEEEIQRYYQLVDVLSKIEEELDY